MMMDLGAGRDAVREALMPVIRSPCWAVKLVAESAVAPETEGTVVADFGEPVLHVGQVRNWPNRILGTPAELPGRLTNLHGTWRLSVERCEWSLTWHGCALASNDSAYPEVEHAFDVLEGQALDDAEVDRGSGATRFSFDLGCQLAVHASGEPAPQRLWTLTTYGHGYFSIWSDGQYSQRSIGPHPTEEVWHPLS